MTSLLKLPNSCSIKYKTYNLNRLFITTKNVFPPTDTFLWIQINIQANDAHLCYWARKICHQTTLTITAILISYWYLITTLTKIIKEKDSRLGAFAKPVWSHNDVFCTVQKASHAICYHICQVANPYQYVCQLSVYQDHSHSHSVMWCHSAWQLILTASMCHDWCQSWCLENPSLQVGLQSPLQQKQTTELHCMDCTTAQAVHHSPVTAHTQVW